MFPTTQRPKSMERTGNQIFIKPSLQEVDNTIQKMGERFGSAVSRFRERKGKADNQKNSLGCRKTSRAWKIFPSADLELDREVENFSPYVSCFTQGKRCMCS